MSKNHHAIQALVYISSTSTRDGHHQKGGALSNANFKRHHAIQVLVNNVKMSSNSTMGSHHLNGDVPRKANFTKPSSSDSTTSAERIQ